MILSMTGFGESTRTQDGVSYQLTVRSLNNRYFKLNWKLPDQATFLEAAIDARLRRVLGRGSIYLTLTVRNMSAEAAYEVNEVALSSYLSHLRGSPAASGLAVTFDLATALLLPGVTQPRQPDEAEQAAVKKTVDAMLDEALGQLLGMRAVEGRAMAADLTVHLDRMAAQLDVIAQRAPTVVVEYRQRLAERVNQLLADQKLALDSDTLSREVALYADRSDIHEEIARLRSHISQFRAAMEEEAVDDVDGGRQVGRKLDFISQEFLREANTIGSKSNDATISKACVEIKSAIDRIKEQVQNAV
ncbi:MAG: YicC family protein [Phycisphaerae bacterium]|nr:YicC family protein [Phycisphaerae bacterium]